MRGLYRDEVVPRLLLTMRTSWVRFAPA